MAYNSIWFHIGSLFFTSLCITNDIFKIRLLLILGNVFILLNALLGWPEWGTLVRKPIEIYWDSIAWPIINITFNLYDIWKDWKLKNKKNNIARNDNDNDII